MFYFELTDCESVTGYYFQEFRYLLELQNRETAEVLVMFYSQMVGVEVYDVSFGNLQLCTIILICSTDGMVVRKAIETKFFTFN